ncbi:glycosyltransferase [Methyloceanibacter sp.]|uniref:glycosyltransferase n=1 Tax=Methyloceanibacter sp. TaxID=1965321 RepID=UPI003D6D05CB
MALAEPNDGLVSLLGRTGIRLGDVAGPENFASADWGSAHQAAVVSDALMRVANPRAALSKIRKHLAPGACLFLSMPLVDGYQARLMGRNWHEWRSPNLWYFSRETLNLLLLATGFEHVWFEPERRRYSLDTLLQRVGAPAEAGGLGRGLDLLRRVSPGNLCRRAVPPPSGTDVVTARTAAMAPSDTVSIIVPAFNEGATFRALMDALLAKQLAGMRKEIIIVESNSTDVTRDLAKSYATHPEVKLLLQSAPRGKGNAVREGLTVATGDIVMIQDADLEYDLDDYDGLLAPLTAWQSMFILGSRHQGGWKMRTFHDAPRLAVMFNFAHWFFRSMINGVLNTRMTDPFTMFKVFRRDALYGLDFTCNRFDFDIELVIKLVRKGYVPVEIPVNYEARSFSEGKKVSVTRDGLTWVWTILKARFAPIPSRLSEPNR